MSTKNMVNFNNDISKKNLDYLAKQLALNHFYSSDVDLFASDDGKIEELKKDYVFKNYKDLKSQNIYHLEGISSIPTDRTNNNTMLTRSILVIGAGGTANSFSDIPLAEKMIPILNQKIIVTTIPSNKKDVENTQITLKYLIDFSEYYREKLDYKDYQKLKYKSGVKILPCEKSNEFLTEQFRDPYNLLPITAQKYNFEYQKWRSTRNKQDQEIDFESFLNILSQILSVNTVRKAIQYAYSIEYGTTLFYSLVAHLFKNRFIDVIINFNFDELLDLAIQEEMGDTEYDIILSDGDCRPMDSISKSGRLRQPLYIKPHGTASHKSSLRFTKDQYHELPTDMRDFLVSLISGRDEKKFFKDRTINLITVGFEMSSVEFNGILEKYLPKNSSIFSFFYHDEQSDVSVEAKKRLDSLLRVFEDKGGDCPFIYLIAHEFYKEQKKYELVNTETSDEKYYDTSNCSLVF